MMVAAVCCGKVGEFTIWQHKGNVIFVLVASWKRYVTIMLVLSSRSLAMEYRIERGVSNPVGLLVEIYFVCHSSVRK